MIVKQLTWLSKSAKEAEVLISDGEYKCIAFSHPCSVQKGEKLIEPLHAFIVNDLMISREKNCSIFLTRPNGLAQQCIAEVLDVDSGVVKIGEIKIIIEEKLPPGILPGDFIEFTCARLDIW